MAIVSHLENIFRQFLPDSKELEFELLATGNINQTYVVKSPTKKFILQSINRNVFPNPELVMSNLNEVMTAFEMHKVEEFLAPLQSTKKSNYYIDENGDYWRVFPFVNHHLVTSDATALRRVGFAYGNFIKDLTYIDSTKIKPTILHFHQLDFYFKQFINVVHLDVKNRVGLCQEEIAFLKSQDHLVATFKSLKIPKKLTHNDAKLDNILFQNKALTKWKVIDYDTIMSGYTIFDFGDLVRSTLSMKNKEANSLSDIVIDAKLLTALKSGFLLGAESVISKDEIDLLETGVVLILYEQAIRFLSDYLSGDCYYRIEYSNQNLVRARRHIWLLKAYQKKE